MLGVFKSDSAIVVVVLVFKIVASVLVMLIAFLKLCLSVASRISKIPTCFFSPLFRLLWEAISFCASSTIFTRSSHSFFLDLSMLAITTSTSFIQSLAPSIMLPISFLCSESLCPSPTVRPREIYLTLLSCLASGTGDQGLEL